MIDEAIEQTVRRAVRRELADLRRCARENEDTSDGKRELLTVEETAELLRLSRNLAYQLIKERRLHALRLGRRLLVPRWAVDELIGYETREPLRSCRYCDGASVTRYLRRNDGEQMIAPVDLCESNACHERLLADLRTVEAIV